MPPIVKFWDLPLLDKCLPAARPFSIFIIKPYLKIPMSLKKNMHIA